MNKVILVLSDALRYDVARENMGFLGHLVETDKASLYRISGELPSMSRPMYETIHTGVPVSEHGIVANSIVQLSVMPNIFKSVSQAGKVTAAAAYSWFSELYNRAPYDRIEDKEIDDAMLPIQHGRFYTEDDYPDIEIFDTAARLVRKYSPDYPLIHPHGNGLSRREFWFRVEGVSQSGYSPGHVACTSHYGMDRTRLFDIHHRGSWD